MSARITPHNKNTKYNQFGGVKEIFIVIFPIASQARSARRRVREKKGAKYGRNTLLQRFVYVQKTQDFHSFLDVLGFPENSGMLHNMVAIRNSSYDFSLSRRFW